jgi:uncharacterized protein YbjT (DUF2867 family)
VPPGFVEAFTANFGRAPSGPGLPNSFDATAIALLAYHAAGRAATGAEIAAQVSRVTDPAGEAIPATVEGFARAMEVLCGWWNRFLSGRHRGCGL